MPPIDKSRAKGKKSSKGTAASSSSSSSTTFMEESASKRAKTDQSSGYLAQITAGGNFATSGRPNTLMGQKQGDHALSFALKERGFKRHFLEEKEGAEDKPLSLGDLRGKRSGFYKYITTLASLHEDRKDELYGKINEIVDKYNAQRIKKSFISDMKRLIETFGITPEFKERNLQELKRVRSANARALTKALEEMVQAAMTICNNSPGVTFVAVEGYEASAGEGGMIKGALSYLEVYCAYLSDPSAINKKRLTERIDPTDISLAGSNPSEEDILFRGLVRNIAKPFFYPQMDVDVIQSQKDKDVSGKSGNRMYGDELYRNNDIRTFELKMAEHLHELLAIYPELEEKREEIIGQFPRYVITQPYEVKDPNNPKGSVTMPHGWPSLVPEPEQSEVSSSSVVAGSGGGGSSMLVSESEQSEASSSSVVAGGGGEEDPIESVTNNVRDRMQVLLKRVNDPEFQYTKNKEHHSSSTEVSSQGSASPIGDHSGAAADEQEKEEEIASEFMSSVTSKLQSTNKGPVKSTYQGMS